MQKEITIGKKIKRFIKKRNKRFFSGQTMLKIIKGWILPLILGVFFFYLLITLPKIPTLWSFLTSNSIGLFLFLIIFVICDIITFTSYIYTLGPFEEETQSTGIAIRKSKKIWMTFWILWSVYCSVIIIKNDIISIGIYLTTTILIIVPSILTYVFAIQVRQDEIKQDEEEKKRLGDKYQEQEPYNKFINEKYENGYYALICIPIFFVLSGIGLAIKHCL